MVRSPLSKEQLACVSGSISNPSLSCILPETWHLSISDRWTKVPAAQQDSVTQSPAGPVSLKFVPRNV